MTRDFQTSKGQIFVRKLNLPENYSKAMVSQAIAALLEEKLEMSPLTIEHTPEGKPFIAELDTLQLSISHAENWIAVYLSETHPAGIDIEIEKEAIAGIMPYFINEKEQNNFKSFSMQELHLIWGAKEAVYKHYEGKFTALEKEVTVTKIDPVLSAIDAESIHGKIRCFYEIICPAVYLVWTEPNI